MNADRTVHASNRDVEVVRYDRAGKWYLEPTDSSLRRRQVRIAEAVDTAIDIWYQLGGTVHFDRHGGQAFDAQVRRRVSG